MAAAKVQGPGERSDPVGGHVEHPLIAPETIERRTYQVELASAALARNTMVVLPTGMGKTVVALLVIAQRLQDRGGKAVFLAPTKPLVQQHADFLAEHLQVEPQVVFTGAVRPDAREAQWDEARVVVATPQVVENDLISGRISLDDVSVLVFDEAHRAVGEYAYVFVGERYRRVEDRLVLGITASPGHDADRVMEVAENLDIRGIEVRTEDDPDVRPYIQETDVEWVRVSIPEEMERVIDLLGKVQDTYVKQLRRRRFVKPKGPVSKTDLLSAQKRIQAALKDADRDEAGPLYHLASGCAAAMKIGHARELAETQGPTAVEQYLLRLEEDDTKAAKRLLDDDRVRRARRLLEEVQGEHPKLAACVSVVEDQIDADPHSRVIVFAHYRDTAELVVGELDGRDGIRPVRFVGQASRGSDKGLSQAEQREVLQGFRRGEHNVLVATSVAEEGLDIPSCDLVVFYEPIPSEIRTIQRRGRTGRQQAGRVVILIARETRDEAYYWSSRSKEKQMRDQLHQLKRRLRDRLEVEHRGIHPAFADGEGQLALEAFEQRPDDEDDADAGADEAGDREPGEGDGLTIWADTREFKGSVAKALARRDVKVEARQLATGDYVVSDRVAVERKRAEDFVQSLLDRRLFPQIKSLSSRYPSPVLVLEGPGLFSSHRVDEAAILGALASIATDFDVPTVATRDADGTARFLIALAKRESEEGADPPRLRGTPGVLTDDERLQFILEGVAGVSSTLAVRLLARFGTLAAIADADVEELMEVEGIGEDRAATIHRTFRTGYGGPSRPGGGEEG